MTSKKKNNPVWITIPDKNTTQPPDKKLAKKMSNPDEVKNKFFWAMGFVAVLIFSFILAMPSTFTTLMKGDLFDGNFDVIPSQGGAVNDAFFEGVDYEEVALEEVQEADTISLSENQLSPANSEAELIDIQPINQPNTEDASDSLFVDVVPQEIAEPEASNTVSEEMQLLLADLNSQLAALKQDSLQKDQQIQSLIDQIQSQSTQHAAALEVKEMELKSAAEALEPSTNGVAALTAGAGYRVNSHTVALTPQEVLAQKKGGQATPPALLEANVLLADSASLGQSQEAPAPMDLSTVNAQPTTGPMESMAFAFLLASFGVLGYTMFRRRL